MRRAVPIHYLRQNDKVWTPPHVVFYDTETRTLPDTEPEVQALRLWVAELVDRRPTATGKQVSDYANGDTAEDFATQLERWCVGRDTVWVFAHNLSFDLTTTRLPLRLAERGWTVTDLAVGGKSPWVRMAKGGKRVTLVDSWSWLPRALEAVGQAVGVAKPALPAHGDSRGAWVARCEADVTILRTAVCELMDWWDRNSLGRWTITGAGCGWNAMRHIPTPQRILVDPDPAGIGFDRAAVHGGRRGVWRVGEQTHGPFVELDFAAAYPSIAAWLPLPVGRRQRFDSLPVDDVRVDHERFGVLAEVELETDTPRWPVKLDRVNWHPVGRFRTTLAGPEIADARRLGCLRAIGPGYVHQLGWSMAAWARWVLAVQYGAIDDAPAVAQMAAKSWGRSVIGKWAGHSFERTELGPAPTLGWCWEDAYHHDQQVKGGVLDFAGKRWLVTESGEAENSYPAILAWVESHVRMRLSRVIEAIGPGAILQCDTDGLILSERLIGTRAAGGHLVAPDHITGPARTKWVIDCLDPVLAPLTLRLKHTVRHLNIAGPQHLHLDDQRRLSGISGSAELGADGKYRARIWPKLQWQMTHGDARGYVRPMVTSQLAPTYATGWVTNSNRVRPPAAYIDAQGVTRLLPWHRTPGRAAHDQLAGAQHPLLDGLW